MPGPPESSFHRPLDFGAGALTLRGNLERTETSSPLWLTRILYLQTDRK